MELIAKKDSMITNKVIKHGSNSLYYIITFANFIRREINNESAKEVGIVTVTGSG